MSESTSAGRPAMADAVDGDEPHIPPHKRGGAWNKPAIGWAMFEFARNPYYLLVIIYIFAPYLAQEVVAANAVAEGLFDGMGEAEAAAAASAHGQAFVAAVTKYSGYFAALTAPILGASLDRGGPRKPVVAIVLGLLGLFSAALWWAKPYGEGLPIVMIGAVMVVAYICFTYSEVIHNAMLSDVARPNVLPQVSGNGLAMGNFAATFLMIVIILCFALPGMIGWPFSAPLFGINIEQHEHERLAGPLAAIWLAIFIWPFFLWCPDTGRKGASWVRAFRDGVAGLLNTLKRARDYKEVLKFLFARMIYADGTSALMALGAVYVTGVLGWNIVERVGYAIWLSIFAGLGGLLGGLLDRTFGIKRAIMIELTMLIIILFLLLSITQESLFYGLVPSVQVLDGTIYSHLHDWFYLLIGAGAGTFVTALLSSSRSMLVAIAPKKMIGEFFGLYAIAGTVTVWLGPMLIEHFTLAFNSQRIGMATLSSLFFLGLIFITFVKYRKGDAVD